MEFARRRRKKITQKKIGKIQKISRKKIEKKSRKNSGKFKKKIGFSWPAAGENFWDLGVG